MKFLLSTVSGFLTGTCLGLAEYVFSTHFRMASWNRVVFSVINGSGPSLQVRVSVGTKYVPYSLSDWLIDPNCHFGYSLMEIHNTAEFGWLFMDSPAGPFVDTYNALGFPA
jgi:hypothetical protein